MNINKKLITATNLNPTKNSRQDYIFTLCENIEKNELTLPLYQRDLSWTLKKCIELLNYQLLNKSPISAISINIINNTDPEYAVPQVSFVDRELLPNILRGQMSVVDGQQRLTTNYKAYCNHPDLKNVVLDLGKGEFVINSESIRRNAYYRRPVLVFYLHDRLKVMVQSYHGNINHILDELINVSIQAYSANTLVAQ